MKKFYLIAMLALAAWVLHSQTNAGVTTNASPSPAAVTNAPRITHIDSDSANFDLNAHRANYRGHVRVSDAEMKLTCEWLVADLPQSGHINQIVAETNVLIDFSDTKGETHHAAAQKAVYHYAVENGATNETVTLTGDPQVEDAHGTMLADTIIWDRLNNGFSAINQRGTYRLRDEAAPTNAPPAKTNAPMTDTNQPVG